MKILITAGGTEEPVDGVRRLTNTSTGATGAELAGFFSDRGAYVLLLRAERAVAAPPGVGSATFVSFADLEAALRRHLASHDFDAVIHLAAVSDYSVASIEVDGRPVGAQGKIPSGADVVIRLKPNPKLIDRLKTWSRNPDIRVVGFKLTNESDTTARLPSVESLLARGTTDFVVHNDLGEITPHRHPAVVWNPHGPVTRTETIKELAELLFELLSDPTSRSAAGGLLQEMYA